MQAAVLQWIAVAAPQVFVFHCPNGGLRNKREAARLKWQGVVAGVPDLVGYAPRAPLAVPFALEVKAPGEYLEPPQREIREKLEGLGVLYAVVRSIDDARAAFRQWGIETREVAG